MSPVASNDPSTVPDTCRSPSMKSSPTRRSFGPRTTELPWPLVPLLPGRLLLNVALDLAVGVDRAVVDELALEDVLRAHRELLAPVAFDFSVFGRSRAFCYRLLSFHAFTPDLELESGHPESGAKG